MSSTCIALQPSHYERSYAETHLGGILIHQVTEVLELRRHLLFALRAFARHTDGRDHLLEATEQVS